MRDVAMVWPLAVRSLRRHRLRYALMSALLGLAVAAYLLYGTFLAGARHEASLRMGSFELPCDVALLSTRTGLTQETLADWMRRGGVASMSTGRLTLYHTSLGSLRVLALPADSPLWAAAGCGDPAAGLAPVPGPRQVVLPATLARAPAGSGASADGAATGGASADGAAVGDRLPLIPPRAPRGRIEVRVVGFHSAADHLLRDVALTALVSPGPLPNCMFIEARSQGAAASLASMLRLEFAQPRRPVLGQADDPIVLWTGTADELQRSVLSGTYMPGAGVMTLVFAFCAIGLFTVSSLGFLDRKRDLAILKTIGLESSGVTAMLLLEQAVVAGAGTAVALTVALLAIPRLGGFLPSGATLGIATVVKGTVAGLVVLGAGVILPALTARVASVNQLLYNLPIPLQTRRVYASKE
jgi:hypothetical protein